MKTHTTDSNPIGDRARGNDEPRTPGRRNPIERVLRAAAVMSGLFGLIAALRSLPDARRYLRMRRM